MTATNCTNRHASIYLLPNEVCDHETFHSWGCEPDIEDIAAVLRKRGVPLRVALEETLPEDRHFWDVLCEPCHGNLHLSNGEREIFELWMKGGDCCLIRTAFRNAFRLRQMAD